MWILYLVLLAIIRFNLKQFNQWFKEYTSDALSNTIEIFLMGFFYSLDRPNNVQDYIKGDFVQSLVALLVLYMTIIILRLGVEKEEI